MKENLKILLIECERNFFFDDRKGNVNEVMLPVGLMYLSSFVKQHVQNTRVDIQLIDLALDVLDDKLLSAIDPAPDVVGIRGMTKNMTIVHESAKKVKEKFPGCLVISGGPYMSADFATALLDRNIDYGVVGEGEYPFLEFINRVIDGRLEDIRKIRGMVSLDPATNKVVENEEQDKPDLNLEPMPDYSLLEQKRYSEVICNAKVRRKQGVIVASRGCPYKCVYCHVLFGKKIRIRTPSSVFEEVKRLWNEYGIKDFFFVDDLFNVNARNTLGFCDLMVKSGIKANLYFQNGFRADICTREVIDACVDAGMVLVGFALETSSPRLQRLIKKYVKIDSLQEMVHYTCNKEIIVCLNTMIGFPSETEEEADDTINFLRQFKKLSLPFFFIARYYPNTEMYNMAVEMGVNPDDLNMHSQKVYHDTTMPTPTFSVQQLNKFYYKYLCKVFFDKERLANCQKILEKYYSPDDILDFYSTLLNRKITDIDKEIHRHARDNTKDNFKYELSYQNYAMCEHLQNSFLVDGELSPGYGVEAHVKS